MKKLISISLIAFSILVTNQAGLYVESATVRIKDVAHVQGVRDNQLVGYGVVIWVERELSPVP